MRWTKKRWRHLPTVALVTPNRLATALLAAPSPDARIRLARWTSAAGNDRDRAIDSSCVRSSPLNTSSAFGRPIAIEVSPPQGSLRIYHIYDSNQRDRTL